MDILITSLTDEHREQRDYRDSLTIKIDGNQEFYVLDGEPEDATLDRDFADCWNIPEMLMKAHAAGKRGEGLVITYAKEGV